MGRGKWAITWEQEDQYENEDDNTLKTIKPMWRWRWVQSENMKTNTKKRQIETWVYEDHCEEEDGFNLRTRRPTQRRGKLQLQVHENHCEGEDGSKLRTQRPTQKRDKLQLQYMTTIVKRRMGPIWKHEDQQNEEVDCNFNTWKPLWKWGW